MESVETKQIPATNEFNQRGLPRPSFSRENPYWRAEAFRWMDPQYRPRLTAVDFLYATTWEISRPFDLHGAYCCKAAMLATYKVNFQVLG